jgi:hypothetical protein
MRAEPMATRLHQRLAELAELCGDSEGAGRHREEAKLGVAKLSLRMETGAETREPGAAPVGAGAYAMALQGDVWNVQFAGQSALVKRTKGMDMLAQLVARPDEEIHVLDLSGAGSVEGEAPAAGLDNQARAEYRQHLQELQVELEESQELGDIGRADALREEMDFITRELSRAFGLGGRERGSGSAAERARVNVRRRLQDAMERIGKQLPDAGKYLKNTIKTGSYCKYSAM